MLYQQRKRTLEQLLPAVTRPRRQTWPVVCRTPPDPEGNKKWREVCGASAGAGIQWIVVANVIM